MRMAFAFVLLALRPVIAEDAAKTWTLKFEWQPVVGMKIHETTEDKFSTSMKISAGGEVVSERESEKTTSFDFVSEITAVSGEDRTGVKWTFKKARVLEDGEETIYGFEGKTVIGKRDKAKKWTQEYADGAPISEDDLSALEGACGTAPKEDDAPSVEDMFSPKKPVKVGETWSPDVKDVAKSFGEGAEIDEKESKGTCTLKSVETRNGANIGTIVIDFNIGMLFPDPIKLEKSIPLLMKGEFRACIDGTLPDETTKLDAEAIGTRKGTITEDGQVLQIELEMDMKVNLMTTKKSIK